MAKDTVTLAPPTAQATAAFFAEVPFTLSPDRPPEILDGLQHLIWTMDAATRQYDEVPAFMVELWVAHLAVLRARVAVLALEAGPVPAEVA
jgi:hypothetical protein